MTMLLASLMAEWFKHQTPVQEVPGSNTHSSNGLEPEGLNPHAVGISCQYYCLFVIYFILLFVVSLYLNHIY